MAALPGDGRCRRAAGVGGTAHAPPALFPPQATKVLAMIPAALGQSQPGMFTALSAREDALLALLGVLAYLPSRWRQPADNGAEARS